jgi:cytochrome oxidase assembly protein ShyY1
MRRLPIIPTIVVAAAVAVMIGLGVWQLQRAGWKDRLLGELASAETLPPVDLDAALAGGDVGALAFRRVRVTCAAREATAALRAGRSRRGPTGYSYFIPCRPGAQGLGGRLQINAGWSQAPNSLLRLNAEGPVEGQIGTVEPDGPVILTADTPIGPLEPSAAPKVYDIPNNHLAYAFQWFFFAATAALIYALALRRRRSVARPVRNP